MDAIKPLRFRGNDIIVFHVLDPAEIDFKFTEASSFQDLETGEQIPVVPTALAEQYRSLVQEHIAALSSRFTQNRVDYALREHVDAARLRAVQISVRAPAAEPGEIDGISRTALLRRARDARRSDPDPSDPARAEADRRVSVADVPAEDPVSVGAPAADPRLAAAGHAAGGDHPDRAGVRAAVLRAPDRSRWPARSGPREVVILLDRSYSMGYGDRWARAQAAARQAVQGLASSDHATLILFGTSAQLEVRATADLSRVARGHRRREAQRGSDALRARR